MWSDLMTESRQVARSLSNVKKSFTAVRYHTQIKIQSMLTILCQNVHVLYSELNQTLRFQRRKLRRLRRSCRSLLKASTCMALELWEMIWRKVTVPLCSVSDCWIPNNINDVKS